MQCIYIYIYISMLYIYMLYIHIYIYTHIIIYNNHIHHIGRRHVDLSWPSWPLRFAAAMRSGGVQPVGARPLESLGFWGFRV